MKWSKEMMQFSILAILWKLFKLFLNDGAYLHIRSLWVPHWMTKPIFWTKTKTETFFMYLLDKTESETLTSYIGFMRSRPRNFLTLSWWWDRDRDIAFLSFTNETETGNMSCLFLSTNPNLNQREFHLQSHQRDPSRGAYLISINRRSLGWAVPS